jgi:hypothetical protein
MPKAGSEEEAQWNTEVSKMKTDQQKNLARPWDDVHSCETHAMDTTNNYRLYGR